MEYVGGKLSCELIKVFVVVMDNCGLCVVMIYVGKLDLFVWFGMG